jgi:hypothetical protein
MANRRRHAPFEIIGSDGDEIFHTAPTPTA